MCVYIDTDIINDNQHHEEDEDDEEEENAKVDEIYMSTE